MSHVLDVLLWLAHGLAGFFLGLSLGVCVTTLSVLATLHSERRVALRKVGEPWR